MKAKQYAQVWNATTPDIAGGKNPALKIIVEGFLTEIHQRIATDMASETADVIAILNQQQKKWNALCRKVEDNTLKPDLFKRMIRKYDPLMFENWEKQLEDKNRSGLFVVKN